MVLSKFKYSIKSLVLDVFAGAIISIFCYILPVSIVALSNKIYFKYISYEDSKLIVEFILFLVVDLGLLFCIPMLIPFFHVKLRKLENINIAISSISSLLLTMVFLRPLMFIETEKNSILEMLVDSVDNGIGIGFVPVFFIVAPAVIVVSYVLKERKKNS